MSHPEIGKFYVGPAYDRPALRRMPSDWRLDDGKRDPWYLRTKWLLLAVVGYAAALWLI